MIALLANRWLQYGVVIAALIGGATWAYHHADTVGYTRANKEWNAYEAHQTQLAAAALATANARIAAKQAELNLARAELAVLKVKNDTETAKSADLQSRLAAGTARLSVLTRQQTVVGSGQNQGGPAAGVDQGTAVTVNLDGTVAANLEWLRSTRDQAIRRLDGCIAAYDAVAAAAQ